MRKSLTCFYDMAVSPCSYDFFSFFPSFFFLSSAPFSNPYFCPGGTLRTLHTPPILSSSSAEPTGASFWGMKAGASMRGTKLGESASSAPGCRAPSHLLRGKSATSGARPGPRRPVALSRADAPEHRAGPRCPPSPARLAAVPTRS